MNRQDFAQWVRTGRVHTSATKNVTDDADPLEAWIDGQKERRRRYEAAIREGADFKSVVRRGMECKVIVP